MRKCIANTYEIVARIGSGNSGIVYKAYHKNLNKYVVLKKVKEDIKDLVNARAEVDVLKNLKHPYLPLVENFVEDDGDIYTVMEFIPGNSFRQYLDAGTSFPESSVIIWIRQIASTLVYLHKQQPPIIHSDLKPGNIMLKPDGNICLIDFNISFSVDGNNAYVTGYTKGYASPEQIEAMKYNQNQTDRSLWKKIDKRSDIYSLGATVYHIMTGQKPEPDESGGVPDIQALKPEINEVFASISMKCLEPEPQKRYQQAEDILEDLKNMPLKSQAYRSLLKKQRRTAVVLSAGMVLCAALAAGGYLQIEKEKQSDYQNAIAKEEECISEGNYEELDQWYQKAVKIFPGKAEAYVKKAEALNREKDYKKCITFINDNILTNEKVMEDGILDGVYYLLGDSYAQLEEYEKAADSYEYAIKLNPENGSYYRDYAITEAYCGDTQKAQKLLDEAEEKGSSTADIEYVKGEIQYSAGAYSEAQKIFMDCIQTSQDSYIQMRAYIMAAKCIDKQDNSTDSQKQKMQLLEKAVKELPQENNIGVLEELAQTYSDLGGDTEDNGYYQKALAVFKQIESQGMGDYNTGCNMAVIYQNMGDYENAKKKLQQVLKTYGEDYRVYKDLAFLEVSVQGETAEDDRDYSKFKEYYDKAKELYQKQLSANANDVEMDRLDELYQQAVNSGWISG